MQMFDAREIEDSLCNTCHECEFLYTYQTIAPRSVETLSHPQSSNLFPFKLPDAVLCLFMMSSTISSVRMESNFDPSPCYPFRYEMMLNINMLGTSMPHLITVAAPKIEPR
jgi:hypothetical protein